MTTLVLRTSFVNDFKNDFRISYPHIHFDDFISDNEIEKYLEDNFDLPYHKIMDLFSDYLLSNGCDVTM